MWLSSLLFLVLLLIWSALLWFVFPIDIFQYSLPIIVGQHVLPPIAAFSMIWFMRFGFRKLQKQRQHNEEARLQLARQAERDKQKELFEAALQNRRIAIDCRWVCASHLSWLSANDQPESNENVVFSFDEPKPGSAWYGGAIVDALESLYRSAPAASCLPIVFCGPVNESTAQWEALIRDARRTARTDLQLEAMPQLTPEFTSLSERKGSLYAHLMALFGRNPAWPGAVILTFDSLAVEFEELLIEVDEQPLSEPQKWRGPPKQALVAMLITPESFATALQQLPNLETTGPLSTLTPHWEREQIQSVMLNFLVSLPIERRLDFAELPVLAKWHRSTSAEFFEATTQSERIDHLKQILQNAAIDARLIEPAFEFDGEKDESTTGGRSLKNCAWLVHNTGHISHGGERMAAVGAALYQSGAELDVIANADNTATTVGDCGVALPCIMQAFAIHRAAKLSAPVLCLMLKEGRYVQFAEMNFVMPVAQ